jgi:hypothetical protein
VGPYVISRHLPICKNGKKDINSIINKCPSIGRIGRRLAGIIKQDVRQQDPCRSLCFLPRIATRVLQRVREDGDETGIVRWLPGRRIERALNRNLSTEIHLRFVPEPLTYRDIPPFHPTTGARADGCRDRR